MTIPLKTDQVSSTVAMDSKNALLAKVTLLASQNIITKEELIYAYDRAYTADESRNADQRHSLSLAELMYLVGAIIIALSVFVFVSQFWYDYSSAVRLLVTGGATALMYTAGYLFARHGRMEALSLAAYLVAAAVVPLFLYVLVDTLGSQLSDRVTSVIVFVPAAIAVAVSYYVTRQLLFAAFCVAYTTLLVYFVVNLLTDAGLWSGNNTNLYVTTAVGAAYIATGYQLLKTTVLRGLTPSLYTFGSFMLLVGALFLGSWSIEETHAVWDITELLLIAGVLYMSTSLVAKELLVTGSFFMILYILKITGIYFSQTLGWPFALMLAGFGIVGASYLSVSIGKRLNHVRKDSLSSFRT